MADSGSVRVVAERYKYKPLAAMVAVQCIFAVSTLWVKATFGRGMMNPMVLVVYRQGIATLFLAPLAIMANRTRLEEMRLGTAGFFLVFVAALFGATAFMNLAYGGLQLGSSSMATAMLNLIPAITFLMAAVVGQERVNVREASSIAKISGTAICFGGAVTMAFFKGSKLLNHPLNMFMLLHSSNSRWMMGALLLVAASSCWSLWLVMQAPICKLYMDPLTLSTWTCFLSTLQSAVFASFMLPDWTAWKINSLFELSCYIFVGAVGSGVCFFLQSWCVSVRGPLYSAMFMPLSTVITTILAAIFLHEELHIGSLLGAIGIVIGLYVVLWGKSEDARNGRVAIMDSQLDIEKTPTAPLLANAGA